MILFSYTALAALNYASFHLSDCLPLPAIPAAQPRCLNCTDFQQDGKHTMDFLITPLDVPNLTKPCFPSHFLPLLLFSCHSSALYLSGFFVMLSSNPCMTKFPNCKEQVNHNYCAFTMIIFQRCPSSYENEEPGLPGYIFSQLPQGTGILLSCADRKRTPSLPMCLQIIRSLQAQGCTRDRTQGCAISCWYLSFPTSKTPSANPKEGSTTAESDQEMLFMVPHTARSFFCFPLYFEIKFDNSKFHLE